MIDFHCVKKLLLFRDVIQALNVLCYNSKGVGCCAIIIFIIICIIIVIIHHDVKIVEDMLIQLYYRKKSFKESLNQEQFCHYHVN